MRASLNLKDFHTCMRRALPMRPSLCTSQLISHSRILQASTYRATFTSSHSRNFVTAHKSAMSYSNTDTGSKPADPHTQKNLSNEASLEEKIKDLVQFAEKHKLCMMTTRIADSGLLVSRCMALAAKVGHKSDLWNV